MNVKENLIRNSIDTLVQMEASRKASCSLLIPARLFPFFDRMLLKYGTVSNLITLFLDLYGNPENCTEIPVFSSRLTANYQAPGLDLIRIDFRIAPEHWHLLKLLARSRGCSICKLFVFLILLFSKSCENKDEFVKLKHLRQKYFIVYCERISQLSGECKRRIMIGDEKSP